MGHAHDPLSQDGASNLYWQIRCLPTFLSTPVFFSRTHCPLCQATHEWFAKEAWVCDFGRLEFEVVRELQVA